MYQVCTLVLLEQSLDKIRLRRNFVRHFVSILWRIWNCRIRSCFFLSVWSVVREFPNFDCQSQYILKSHPIYSHGLAPCVNKMFVQKYFLTVSVWVKKCHESFKQSVMVSYLWVEIPSFIVYSIYFCILQYENACVSISICSSYILKCFTLLSKHTSKIMTRSIRYPLIFRIVQSPLK